MVEISKNVHNQALPSHPCQELTLVTDAGQIWNGSLIFTASSFIPTVKKWLRKSAWSWGKNREEEHAVCQHHPPRRGQYFWKSIWNVSVWVLLLSWLPDYLPPQIQLGAPLIWVEAAQDGPNSPWGMPGSCRAPNTDLFWFPCTIRGKVISPTRPKAE